LNLNETEMSYKLIQNDSSYGVFSVHYKFGDVSCPGGLFKQIDSATIDTSSTFLNLYHRAYGDKGVIVAEGRIDEAGQNIGDHLNNLYAKFD
jgi:hypothetical protein